jgi:predicted DNA-binding transcriptional regulator YafY
MSDHPELEHEFTDLFHDALYLTRLEEGNNNQPNILISTIEEGSENTLAFSLERAVEIATQIMQLAGHDAADAQEASLNEVLVRLAIQHKRGISFFYEKGEKGGTIEGRQLRPESFIKEDPLVFFGQDPLRDEPRAFRLDRVRGTVILHGDELPA